MKSSRLWNKSAKTLNTCKRQGDTFSLVKYLKCKESIMTRLRKSFFSKGCGGKTYLPKWIL